jgi:hypothetical protein
MASDRVRGGASRRGHLIGAGGRAGLLAALAATVLAGCGVGPFADTGAATDSSAPASAGPGTSNSAGASPSPSPLISGLRDPNSAVGTLAPGFPSDLLPVPPDGEVLVSSVQPVSGSDAYQVSLNMRTALAAPDVVDLYRKSLTAAGFAEAPQTAQAAALAAQSTFTRSGGDELLVIGVLDRDGVRTVTIGGRLRRGK